AGGDGAQIGGLTAAPGALQVGRAELRLRRLGRGAEAEHEHRPPPAGGEGARQAERERAAVDRRGDRDAEDDPRPRIFSGPEVRAAEPDAERPADRERHRGVPPQQVLERRFAEEQQLRVQRGDDGVRSRLSGQPRHLSEALAGPEPREDASVPSALRDDAHLPRVDDVEAVARIPLLEDGVAAAIAAAIEARGDGLALLVTESVEDLDVAEDGGKRDADA